MNRCLDIEEMKEICGEIFFPSPRAPVLLLDIVDVGWGVEAERFTLCRGMRVQGGEERDEVGWS